MAVGRAKAAGTEKCRSFNGAAANGAEVPTASDAIGQGLFVNDLFLGSEPRFVDASAGNGQAIDIVLSEARDDFGNAVGIGLHVRLGEQENLAASGAGAGVVALMERGLGTIKALV